MWGLSSIVEIDGDPPPFEFCANPKLVRSGFAATICLDRSSSKHPFHAGFVRRIERMACY